MNNTEIHYGCNNPAICIKKIQPDSECKKENCKFCIESEIYAVDKPGKISLEW